MEKKWKKIYFDNKISGKNSVKNEPMKINSQKAFVPSLGLCKRMLRLNVLPTTTDEFIGQIL